MFLRGHKYTVELWRDRVKFDQGARRPD